MRVGFIALATLATVLVIAPAAMAFGGGGGRKGGGGDFSASFVNGGPADGSTGSSQTAGSPGASNGVTASEPLAVLAVGLGLLGTRYLRRR